MERWRSRLGGLVWLLVGGYFVAQPVVASAWPRPYSWSVDYISDLGATRCGPEVCSPRHGVMNVAFVGAGVLIVLGVVLLRPWLRSVRASGVGLVLVALGGLGTVVVGLFPSDLHPLVHGAAAAVHIPAQALGLLLVGLGGRPRRRPVALAAVVCGVLSLAGVVLFFGGLTQALGVGGSERLADYPFYGWVTLTGLAFLVRPPRQGTSTDG